MNKQTGINGIYHNHAWGVYVHVPFCVARCNYCDFNTYAGMERYIDAYFGALEREVRTFFGAAAGDGDALGAVGACDGARGDALGAAGACAGAAGVPEVDSVFFGGGTPSFVEPGYIAGILALIRSNAAPRRDIREWECTIEANPGTVDRHKLEAYARAGINRVSFGLQSTHDIHLKMLGRVHSYEDFASNVREAKKIGFRNLNADLLFGLPGQTMKEWEQTLETVVDLGIRHISCYSLSIEETTPLHTAIEKGELPMPDDGLDRDMYSFARSYLRSAGIYQYELSNFAEPGHECLHNLKYWTAGRYIGFGAGAHSYDGHKRLSNKLTIDGYIRSIEAGELPIAEFSPIDAVEREKEFIILRLRLTDGFADGDFRAEFGYSFYDKYCANITDLTSAGLIEADSQRVRLTAKGMDLANQVFVRFI